MKIYTVTELASALGVSRQSVFRAIKAGRLTSVKRLDLSGKALYLIDPRHFQKRGRKGKIKNRLRELYG